ncbi:MobF family relaxase [Aurantimonas sp. Leaf443]|uniref:MobF family relaxase n=1 Tax=Aurantimonas sp. Leaf443 TaxID=1736378 RepID=UPI001FCE2C37|nr:MobF family relaxase [Aurantimonas sp. Leaf443]
MVATVAAGTSAQYYLAQVEYYLGGKEPDGRWIKTSPGLGSFPSNIVDGGAFERLHAARDEDGRPLISNTGKHLDQVGGYDVCFSPPKSLQVLWGLGAAPISTGLEAVQLAAVQEAVDFLDREAAFCRRGRNGLILEKVSLTAAAFQHGEARPAPHADGAVFADPALHTHVVVLNVAERADGSFGRLDGRLFYNMKMAAGALYHEALSRGLRQMGFSVEITGNNGIFEIVGVDRDLCKYFSARRDEIASELAAIGLETSGAPALAAAKARATRRGKSSDGPSGDDRHQLWRERAAGLGFEAEHVVEQALAAGRERALVAHTEPPTVRTLYQVLQDLTERASVFEYRQLVAAVASAKVGADRGTSVEEELERFRTKGAMVALGSDRWRHAIYSTPEIIALEQGLFARARQLASLQVAAPSSSSVEALLQNARLNHEQEQAARLACTSTGIVIVEGAPGVGKTTLLAPVARAWGDAGWRVIGASTAWKIAHQLRDELQIEARAVDSWLAAVEHGKPFLTDKTLLVIDEAGLLTSRQMDRILSEVERAHSAGFEVAVRMVGDRRQLQPIGGPGLRIVAEAIGTQRVDVIVRQHEPWARDVVTDFGRGEAAVALGSLKAHGCVRICEGPSATINGLVDAWDEWRRDDRGRLSLLIAKTNAQVLALNKEARQRLRTSGEIAADNAASIEAVTPSGQSHIVDLAEGDRIRFLCRNDELGIINGTHGCIERVDLASDGAVWLQTRIGSRSVSFTPSELADEAGRAQLAHAYATTCYGAQGLTTDHAFVLADPAMDRHDIHVATSRGRSGTHLFVDGKALDTRAKAERLLGDRDRVVDPSERLALLAAALSRSGAKSSTLDYLMPAAALSAIERSKLDLADEPLPKPGRRRSRGISLE